MRKIRQNDICNTLLMTSYRQNMRSRFLDSNFWAKWLDWQIDQAITIWNFSKIGVYSQKNGIQKLLCYFCMSYVTMQVDTPIWCNFSHFWTIFSHFLCAFCIFCDQTEIKQTPNRPIKSRRAFKKLFSKCMWQYINTILCANKQKFSWFHVLCHTTRRGTHNVPSSPSLLWSKIWKTNSFSSSCLLKTSTHAHSEFLNNRPPANFSNVSHASFELQILLKKIQQSRFEWPRWKFNTWMIMQILINIQHTSQ